MKCYNCEYEIKDQHLSTCPLCGVGLLNECDNCSAPNPDSAKFCLQCGKPLTVNISSKNTNQISENLREVGVIFADVSGFTGLSEKLAPEVVKQIINGCFQQITKPAYELGGIVDKYIGDCVMLSFGASNAHKDDAMRAVTCALQMNAIMKNYSDEVFHLTGKKLELSIGVSYGFVSVGKVGSKYDNEDTIIGDVVNVASRLQEIAKPGEVFVSSNAFEETKNKVVYSDGITVTLRNKSNEVVIYNPISIQYRDEAQSIITRIDEEQMILGFLGKNNRYNGLEITGAKGAGKTTLINSVLSKLSLDINVVNIKTNEVSSIKPYGVVEQILQSILGVNKEDDKKDVVQRVQSYIRYILDDHLEETKVRNYNFIALLLGLDRDNDYDSIFHSMSYVDIQTELSKQLLLFLQYSSERQKQLIIIDGANLLDNRSKQLFESLMDYSGHLIYISQLKSINHDDNFVLNLPFFTEQQMDEYIELKTKLSLGYEDLKYLFTITEGNPQYLEEICYVLLEQISPKEYQKHSRLDSSIIDLLESKLSNLLLSRLDLLSNIEKNFLQISALVGVDFDVRIPMNVLSMGDNSEDVIEVLLTNNFIEEFAYIRVAGGFIKKYRFIQNETRNHIRNGISDTAKTEMHERIAKYLVKLYDVTDLDHYNEIAYHYEQSGQALLAKEYYYDYAVYLMKNFEFDIALDTYNTYLNIENSLNHISSGTNVVKALIDSTKIMINISKFKEAEERITASLNRSLELTDKHELQLLLIDVYKATANIKGAMETLDLVEVEVESNSRHYGKMLQHQCTIYNMVGKPGVIEIADKSEEILLKSKDFISVAETMTQSGIRSFIDGDISNGIDKLEKAIDFAKLSGNLTVQTKININLGILYSNFGEKNKSNNYFIKAMELSKLISSARNYISAEINLGVSYLHSGLFQKASKFLKEATEMAQHANLVYQECIASTNLADVQYELGNFDLSKELFTKSLKISTKIEMPIESGINKLGLSKVSLKQGVLKDVLIMLDETEKIFSDSKELSYLASSKYYKSEYYKDMNKHELSLSMANEGVVIAMDLGNPLEEIKLKRKKCEILLAMEDYTIVDTLLEEILNQAINLKQHYEIAKIYYLLSKYHQSVENEIAFVNYLQKANEEIKHFDTCSLSNRISNDVLAIVQSEVVT